MEEALIKRIPVSYTHLVKADDKNSDDKISVTVF